MTVRELIDLLQRCDPDLPVIRNGYETGYDDVDRVEILHVTDAPPLGDSQLGPFREWWDGKYVDAERGEPYRWKAVRLGPSGGGDSRSATSDVTNDA